MGAMNQDKRLTEKEIDNLVVSQVDDPTAWEEEIRVHPKRWRVNPSRIELAAKFFVLSALHRLGAEATVALGEHGDTDIAVLTNTGRTLTVEVKAVTGSTRWRVEEIHAKRDHYIVFVCFVHELSNPHVSPEVYVLSSDELRDVVTQDRLTELQLSDLGERMKVREAWDQLMPSTAA
jgi:hypothetical protein